MGSIDKDTTEHEERLDRGIVLIAGGGPVGLLLATVLAHYDVKSVLLERNFETTKWPKMDLTNARSMELFRRLGLADELRKIGVPAHIDQPVLFSSGLASDEPLSKWALLSPDRWRKQINECNDGTQPLEPWQRLSQVVLERWLKGLCDSNPLIDVRFGWRVESVEEKADEAVALVQNISTGEVTMMHSDYMAGCDGASSRARKSLELPLDGGPIPSCALLVHFKSKDLTRLHKQGQFWHIFLLNESGQFGGAIIAQDEVDTWTTHLFVPLDVDVSEDAISSEEAVARVLGGAHGPYPVKIDEVLVRSVWRPNICVARKYAGPHCRVLLAGDAVHQNIPTGGYGMNMGIGDAFDLGWKLAAVVHGQGGHGLLESYELERRPIALCNVERSGQHFQVHTQLAQILDGFDVQHIQNGLPEARAIRERIDAHYTEHDSENKDLGIEMGQRYRSHIIVEDEKSQEPEWNPRNYVPTTWPGSRAPHVFLSDSVPIFDKFGKYWTLLSFSNEDIGQSVLARAATMLSVPLTTVDLSKESVARSLYETDLVLVRPDEHVAWRGDSITEECEALRIFAIVTGRQDLAEKENVSEGRPGDAFSATTEMKTQTKSFDMEKLGAFQQ